MAQDVIAKQAPLDASIHNFACLQWLESVRQDNFTDPKIGLLPLDMLVGLIVQGVGMHLVTVHLDPDFEGGLIQCGSLRRPV